MSMFYIKCLCLDNVGHEPTKTLIRHLLIWVLSRCSVFSIHKDWKLTMAWEMQINFIEIFTLSFNHLLVPQCSVIGSRSVTEQACSWELISTAIWDFQTTRYFETFRFLFILACITFFLLDHIIDARDKPARPRPARPGHDALSRVISRSVHKLQTWKFETCIKV